MGLIKANLLHLLRYSLREPFSGSILALGHIDVYFTINEFKRMAAYCGVTLKEVPIGLSERQDFRERNFINAETVFTAL